LANVSVLITPDLEEEPTPHHGSAKLLVSSEIFDTTRWMRPPRRRFYLPYLQDETNHDMATMSLFLRTDGNGMALADSVRNRIHAVDPNQPVQNIQDVADLVSQSVATRRYTLILVSAFAAVGLLLAAVGVYGVIFLRDFAKGAGVRNPDRARGNARTRHVVCLAWQA